MNQVSDKRLRKISGLLRILTLVFAALLPVGVGYWWLAVAPGSPQMQPLIQTPGTSNWQWVVGGLIVLFPLSALSGALVIACGCFKRFSQGEFISAGIAQMLARFGIWITVSGFAGLLAPTVLSLVLTAHAPPGERMLVISLGSGPLLSVLLGLMIWAIGGVMARAALIAEENAQFV